MACCLYFLIPHGRILDCYEIVTNDLVPENTSCNDLPTHVRSHSVLVTPPLENHQKLCFCRFVNSWSLSAAEVIDIPHFPWLHKVPFHFCKGEWIVNAFVVCTYCSTMEFYFSNVANCTYPICCSKLCIVRLFRNLMNCLLWRCCFEMFQTRQPAGSPSLYCYIQIMML